MKVLVSFSGGMDSATILALAVERFGAKEVDAIGFQYGSKHNKYELVKSVRFCHHFGVRYFTVDVQSVFHWMDSNLLKTGGDIPEGHYEHETMKQTVVPGRNLIFTSILAGMAQTKGAERIWLGVHSGDHAIYPDCRPEFINAIRQVVHLACPNVAVEAPFLDADKTAIIQEGLKLNVPYEMTRTCYKDQPIACGKCGSCQERLEAFKANDMEDPLEYESRTLLPKDVTQGGSA